MLGNCAGDYYIASESFTVHNNKTALKLIKFDVQFMQGYDYCNDVEMPNSILSLIVLHNNE